MHASRPLTVWGMAWRNLFRQRTRTALTVFGVGIGVVAMVAFSAISRGMWRSAEAAITFGGTDLLVFQAGVSIDLYSRLNESETRAYLKSVPGVEDSAATLAHILPIAHRPFVLICGLEEDGFIMESAPELVAGRHVAGPDEVAIGVIAQRMLDKTAGDTLEIHRRTFKISGVFRSGVVFYDAGVVMWLRPLQDVLKRKNDVTMFQLRLADGADVQAVIDDIESSGRSLVGISDINEYNKVDQGLQMGDAMVQAITLLSLVVGCIVVANTMWMSVYERTREIGVLRAVGISSRSVVALILIEALGIAGIASFVGCLVGIGLAKIATRMPFFDAFTDPVFEWPLFARAAGMALALSAVGGIWPAWRASRITPVEALRYE